MKSIFFALLVFAVWFYQEHLPLHFRAARKSYIIITNNLSQQIFYNFFKKYARLRGTING
jgi:hypothetical protein